MMNYNFNNCALTLNTTRKRADNPVDTAVEVSRMGFTHMKPNDVILVNKNEVFHGITASPLMHFPINAALLYTDGNRLNRETLNAIKNVHDINVYILGSSKTVSKAVERNLSDLNNVKHLDRIDGETPYEIAVNFAKYRDPKTEFGWGRNYRDGHGFTFGTLNHPMEIIAGVLFAHMGKHTPLLLTGKANIPAVVERYIKSVKPMPPKDMPRPPFMHGFLLGGTSYITHPAQMMIEDFLSIDHEMMNIEHEDNMHNMHHD